MNRFFVSFATLAAASLTTTASAQFSAATPKPVKTSVTTATSSTGTGGYLNTDDCNAPHRAGGSGDQLGVPFVTGTTGMEGQNEANCYAFGTSAIDNDVWFDWTATTTGNGTLTSCNGTAVDTKIAVWPGTVGCPADGTSLGCNDDACGLQSTVVWPVSAGTTYTFQIGTFPGSSGGSGTFDVTQPLPPPCGVYDDGGTENALGLTAGGETGWLHNQECMLVVEDVQTAYGSMGGTNPANGTTSRVAVYEDSDCDRDPATGPLNLLWSAATTVTNSGTDILNSNPTGGVAVGSRCSWVMATVDQPAGVFPAPMDTNNPTPKAWIVGQTPAGASMDIDNLTNNNVPPLQMQAIGFPAAWLLRAVGTDSVDGFPTQCFGDTGCPCSNNSGNGGGCANSTGAGAVLSGSGEASLSNDTFALSVTDVSNSFGLFFQGDNRLDQMLLGDGLRCCGGNVVRIGTYLATGNATDTVTGNLTGGFGPPITTLPGQTLSVGDTLCYQYWYRDVTGPCSFGFNTSNAVKAQWTP